jgi:hypothetical protein
MDFTVINECFLTTYPLLIYGKKRVCLSCSRVGRLNLKAAKILWQKHQKKLVKLLRKF